jgi:predicted transcriptional regulator
MVRTQIYLTAEESRAIARLGKAQGRGKSEVIRQAIDEFILRRDATGRLKTLRAARGMWADHADLPNLREMRKSFDRF